MVKLALYKGRGTLANALIRWWTGSIYSHCELVVDGWCYSSSVMDKGVRRKQIDLDSGNWDCIELPWVDARKVIAYFEATDYQQYGWLGLIGSQLFNRGLSGSGSQFCSQWCANAAGLSCASIFGPESLGQTCKYISRTMLALECKH